MASSKISYKKLPHKEPAIRNGYELVNDEKFDEAMALANSCLYFDKKFTQSGRDTKAYCLLKMGKHKEALAILDRRLLFAPDDRWALNTKARRLSTYMGLYDEAIRSSNRYIRIAKNSPKPRRIYEAYWIKAYVLYEAGKYKQAMQWWKKSLQCRPLRRYLKENAEKGIKKCMVALWPKQ